MAGVGSGSGGSGMGSGGVATGWAGVGSGCVTTGRDDFWPGVGLRACTVSGNWVVALSGTLGSTRLLKTSIASVERSDRFDGAVIARLDEALRVGLIGCAYWYTT